MTKFYGWVIAVALAVTAFVVLVRNSRESARLSEAVRIAEEQETVAVAFARHQTDLLVKERAKTLQAERELYQERITSQTSLQSADSIIADAHQVLRDSASTNATLRASLVVTVNNLDSLSLQFRRYIDKTDSVLYRVAVERVAADSALSAERGARLATERARDALRREMQCKVWFVSCPTRTQSFILGAIATGAVVIALR